VKRILGGGNETKINVTYSQVPATYLNMLEILVSTEQQSIIIWHIQLTLQIAAI